MKQIEFVLKIIVLIQCMSHSCSFDHADFFNTNFTIVYGDFF